MKKVSYFFILILIAFLFFAQKAEAISINTFGIPTEVWTGDTVSGTIEVTTLCNLNHDRVEIEVIRGNSLQAWAGTGEVKKTLHSSECRIDPCEPFPSTCQGTFTTPPIIEYNNNTTWTLKICAIPNPADKCCTENRTCIFREFNVRVPFCGDGKIEGNEECEPGPPPQFRPGDSCITRGFSGGQLRCTPDCHVDTSQCLGVPTQPTGYDNPLLWANIPQFLLYALRFIFNILLGVSILMIVIAGIFLAASRGDPIRQAKGKRTLLFAVLGFAIAFLAQGLFMLFRIIFGVRF